MQGFALRCSIVVAYRFLLELFEKIEIDFIDNIEKICYNKIIRKGFSEHWRKEGFMRRSKAPVWEETRYDEQKNEEGRSRKTPIYLSGAADFVISAGVLTHYEGVATTVSIPHGVVEIGAGAFAGYEKLKSVTIPSTVCLISENAFNGCASLREIRIPRGVTSIKRKAFYGCVELTDVIFERSDRSLYIDESAFQLCLSLQKLLVSRDVEFIGKFAFANCTALSEVRLKGRDQVYLSEGAFKNCKSLKKVTIAEQVYFKYPVFENCRDEDHMAFKRIILSDRVKLDRSLCCAERLTTFGKRCRRCGLKHIRSTLS